MSKNRKRILHIVPYSNLYPPSNGGQLRCFHIGIELSKQFEVVLLTLQPRDTFPDRIKSQIQILNPKKKVKYRSFLDRIKNAVKFRWVMKSITQSADATVLNFYGLIKDLKREGEMFDFVIMEHLSSMKLGKVIKSSFPNAVRIVDQHNVDHLLYKQNHPILTAGQAKEYYRLKIIESQLFKFADSFLACSVKDKNQLLRLNEYKLEGVIVPNGTTCKNDVVIAKNFDYPKLIFCGSLDYEPNQNGLLWFYNEIWFKLKKDIEGISFTVIGRNPNRIKFNPLIIDDTVQFVGEVDDVTDYYKKNNIAIVPLKQGSGTRLKILEAMSFGLPVISTSIGAEGIDYKDSCNILIANTEDEFIKSIKLATQSEISSKLIVNAFKLLEEKYYWSIIINNLAEQLGTLKK